MTYKGVRILIFSFFSLVSWHEVFSSFENSSWFWPSPDFSSSCMVHVILILNYYVLPSLSLSFLSHTSVCWDIASLSKAFLVLSYFSVSTSINAHRLLHVSHQPCSQRWLFFRTLCEMNATHCPSGGFSPCAQCYGFTSLSNLSTLIVGASSSCLGDIQGKVMGNMFYLIFFGRKSHFLNEVPVYFTK